MRDKLIGAAILAAVLVGITALAFTLVGNDGSKKKAPPKAAVFTESQACDSLRGWIEKNIAGVTVTSGKCVRINIVDGKAVKDTSGKSNTFVGAMQVTDGNTVECDGVAFSLRTGKPLEVLATEPLDPSACA